MFSGLEGEDLLYSEHLSVGSQVLWMRFFFYFYLSF